MIITRRDSVPKTANLLACKQWWKVCFPHGDQEKYYRQIYGRAAAQRLANSQKDDNKLSANFGINFPTKLPSDALNSSVIDVHDYPCMFSQTKPDSAAENVNDAESNKVSLREM